MAESLTKPVARLIRRRELSTPRAAQAPPVVTLRISVAAKLAARPDAQTLVRQQFAALFNKSTK